MRRKYRRGKDLAGKRPVTVFIVFFFGFNVVSKGLCVVATLNDIYDIYDVYVIASSLEKSMTKKIGFTKINNHFYGLGWFLLVFM